MMSTHRSAILLLPLGLVVGVLPGCGRLEWNWNPAWWQRPRRIVRPAKVQPPANIPNKSEAPSPSEGENSAQRNSNATKTEPVQATSHLLSHVAIPPVPKTRPYYQLYLLSDKPSPGPQRGEAHVRLNRATAQPCARLLEMLYVPLGRSGSSQECYLIYEQREEFEAARTLAPLLDLKPDARATSTVGPEAAFKAGIAAMLWIIDQGAIVDRAVIDRCEHHLAEASQAAHLSRRKRWAAAVLGGRLLSDYRYNYGGARRDFNQALRLSKEGSIEAMTAQWWRADTFVQEGKTAQADAAYRTILRNNADQWPGSQIIARSKAILKQLSKNSH